MKEELSKFELVIIFITMLTLGGVISIAYKLGCFFWQ
jgi:hypothetical protein